MSEGAYSTLLLTGLVAGSAAAFLTGGSVLPLFAVFPLASLLAGDARALVRTVGISLLPACTLAWALWSGHGSVAVGATRWLAAVAAGSSIASALGSSRASVLLREASLRIRSGGLLESLSMVLALAGPFSEGVRRSFRNGIAAGRGVGPSVVAALDALGDVRMPPEPAAVTEHRAVHAAAAAAAWLLFILSLAGVA